MSSVLTYRLIKTSPLTEAEFDGNIHNLDDRAVAIEAQMPVVSVTDAQINTGGHLEIFLSNNTVIDAGPMPVGGSFSQMFKGVWTPLTVYHANDLFTAPGSNWLGVVLRDHTSASTFDWGANDGMGHDYYAVVIPFSPNPAVVTLSSASHTLTLDDANTYIRSTHASTGGVPITIPTDAAVPFAVSAEISFCQRGGALHFIAAGGVILNFPEDSNPVTEVIGAVVTLKKVGTNEWDLFGRLQRVTG